MSKKIQLSIPVPCHENWDNMSPVEKGKFCGSCQKQVVDFTSMNDREVAQFFKKPSTGSVCGRFMVDQLERDIEIPKKRVPWLKYFFQIALPALLFSKLSAQKTMGKIAAPVQRDTTKISVRGELRTLGMVLPTHIKPAEEKKIDTLVKNEIKSINFKTTITGKIIDEKGSAIPFASITTGKPGIGVMADESGNFLLSVNSLSTDSLLHISSVGYKSIAVEINREDAVESKMMIDLKPDIVLPELVLSAKPVTIQCFSVAMGGLAVSRKIENEIELIPSLSKHSSSITIFPNPVKTGNTINIKFKKPQAGNYFLQLLNQSGQLIQTKEIRIEKGIASYSLELPSVPAGSYFVVLTNKETGKKSTEKMIVQ